MEGKNQIPAQESKRYCIGCEILSQAGNMQHGKEVQFTSSMLIDQVLETGATDENALGAPPPPP